MRRSTPRLRRTSAARARQPLRASEPPDDLAEYTDLSYRDQFWAVREYEDQCDRVAIRALLPPSGGAILDLGAGFGRLADEYLAYHRVVLFDASETLLAAAREKLAGDERIEFVQGDAHRLPFEDGSFDAATCIRVLVHVRDPRPVLTELARVVRPEGTVVIEFANRRHLLAVVRHLARRQDWSPFDPAPHEYKPLHFAHQPKTIRRVATGAGFRVSAERTVSLFRTPAISRRVAVPTLIRIERPLQTLLAPLRPGPSTYLRLIRR